MFTKIKNTYVTLAQKISASVVSPTEKQARVVLFLTGVAILGIGLSGHAIAQGQDIGVFNDDRLQQAIGVVMGFLEGSFGALIMTASGVGAIMSAAFGNYKAAMSLLVVAVGSFILRSLVSTFFDNVGF